MNNLEMKMIDTLKDLKENHHVLGVKAEFEAEGTRLEEALRLKEVVTKAGLELTIKIGGCEAIKDMYDARTIGVNTIVAPMIESPYAVSKYLKAAKIAFPDDERNQVKFLINIETKYGLQYLEEILRSDFALHLSGIVFGRTDMTGSMGMTNDDVDCEKIFELANRAAILTQKYKKELVMGGAVTAASLPFFRKLPGGSVSRYETRKIIFDSAALNDKNADKGIIKAFEFEKLWIKNKRNYYERISHEDDGRIEVLEARARLH